MRSLPRGDQADRLRLGHDLAAGISGHGASGYLAGNGLLATLGLSFIAADHVAGRR